MTAEAHNQPEPIAPRPELALVPAAEVPNITDQVAKYVQAIDNELVPRSVEEADEAVKMIRTQNEQVQQSVRAGESSIDADVAADFQDIAEQGTDVWKLSQTEQRDYQTIVQAKKPAQLTESAQAYLDGSKPFAVLKAEAKARLTLDRELRDRELAQQADKLAVSMRAAGFDIDVETTKPGKPTQAKRETTKAAHETQADLTGTGIKLDANGRGHRDHGKFISKKQLEQIEANADLIRNDQQGSREEYETREAIRQAELDARIATKAKKAAFKQGFGTRALERVDGLKLQLEDEAANSLANEGHDVSYRTKTTEAEPLSMPDGFNENAWHILNDAERQVAIEEWGKLSEQEKADTFTVSVPAEEQATTETFDFNRPVKDMDSKTRAAYFANARKAEADKSIGSSSEEAHKTTKKRRLAAAIVGSGALAGALLYAAQHNAESDSGASVPQHVVSGTKLHPKFDTVKVRPGDTIWGDEKANHPRMDEQHIEKLVQRDLRANHMSWQDARHLQPGQHIKISHKK